MSNKKRSKAARALSSKLGWIARRARAGYLGHLARVQRESQRAKGRGSRPPGAIKRRRRSEDSLEVYSAPRDTDGTLAPQPALGGGSVTQDMMERTGAKVARDGINEAYSGVSGLWRVRAIFNVEGDDEERNIVRTSTVDISRGASAQERERVVARAVQDMARSIIEKDSSRTVTLSSVVVERAEGAKRAGYKRKRVEWKSRKKRGDKKRPRGRGNNEAP